MFSQIRDRKHIERNFHSVARGHAPGVELGMNESKTLAWGFAMASHRLHIHTRFGPDWCHGLTKLKYKRSCMPSVSHLGDVVYTL